MKRYVIGMMLSVLLASACREEEDFLTTEKPAVPLPSGGTTELQFCFSGQTTDSRIAETDDLTLEEGQVNSLVYAIFQDGIWRSGGEADLSKENGLSTAPGKNVFRLSGISNQWLTETSEIFAVANAPQVLKQQLLDESPDGYTVPADHPEIVQQVAADIEQSAFEKVCDERFIPNNYRQDAVPADGKVYYLPADDQNNYMEKQWSKTKLPDTWRFATYAEFSEKKQRKDMPASIREIYGQIEADLRCRLEYFGKEDYRKQIKELTDAENASQTLTKSYQEKMKRYFFWKTKEYEEDLNATAAKTDSRLIEQPLMAGHMDLSKEFGAVIRVPVEHVYCRIWFNFEWQDSHLVDRITIESVEVDSIWQNTRLFNAKDSETDNNPDHPMPAPLKIANGDTEQLPFLGRLVLPPQGGSYHEGDTPQMVFTEQGYAEYPILCRYPWSGGQVNRQARPVRYYAYSYQWGGTSINDNPVIRVTYSFRSSSAEGGPDTPGGSHQAVRKQAKAKLYDPGHFPGKRHHGLLRNYTYQLNCAVSALTNTLDIQVVSVPWVAVEIDDIPPFE